MAGLIIDTNDYEKICIEFNRIGAFLTAVFYIRDEVLANIIEEDWIARAFFEKKVISEAEMNRITSHQHPTISKGTVLLDVLKTKESRDVTVLLDFLQATKQLDLARRIDEVFREVNRIVNWKVDAVAPTMYRLPLLSTPLMQSTQNPKADILGTEDGVIKIFRREAWGAEPKRGDSPVLGKELPYVIISHTAQIGVYDTAEKCLNAVLEAQQLNFSMEFADIAFNYLVGNDGAIYEGRGHSHEAATARGWNHRSIGIAFIGKYVDTLPSQAALDALKAFLKYLKEKGVLAEDFTIHCLRQVRERFPDAPGDPLYKEIQTWRANDPEGWAWREKDDEEEANKSDGDPLSDECRAILKEEQPDLVTGISNTLKLLDMLGAKGVLNRFLRKDMRKRSKKLTNSDEELKKEILEHIFSNGTYQDVEKLIDALAALHQTRVGNKMYKLFPAEVRKKLNIEHRRKKDMPPYKEIPFEEIHFVKLHGNGNIFIRLGVGKYGKIQLATMDNFGDEPVAVKILNELQDNNETERSERIVRRFKEESEMHFQLRHKNITTVFGIVCEPTNGYYWIVMEHMANGSLNNLLEKVVIPWPVKVRMMRDIARAMEFLYTEQGEWRKFQITHGDLKAANILIDEYYTAKISDFGSAVKNCISTTDNMADRLDKPGTLTHTAPELIRIAGKYEPNEKSDMWSFGITLFEVSAENTRDTDEWRVPFNTGIPDKKVSADMDKSEWHPFNDNSAQMDKIPIEQCPKVFIEVMFHCCEKDPEKRPDHFSDIAKTLDDAYQKKYGCHYKRGLARLILQDEASQQKYAADQEPMEQEHGEVETEEEKEFELESVAPVFGPSFSI